MACQQLWASGAALIDTTRRVNVVTVNLLIMRCTCLLIARHLNAVQQYGHQFWFPLTTSLTVFCAFGTFRVSSKHPIGCNPQGFWQKQDECAVETT